MTSQLSIASTPISQDFPLNQLALVSCKDASETIISSNTSTSDSIYFPNNQQALVNYDNTSANWSLNLSIKQDEGNLVIASPPLSSSSPSPTQPTTSSPSLALTPKPISLFSPTSSNTPLSIMTKDLSQSTNTPFRRRYRTALTTRRKFSNSTSTPKTCPKRIAPDSTPSPEITDLKRQDIKKSPETIETANIAISTAISKNTQALYDKQAEQIEFLNHQVSKQFLQICQKDEENTLLKDILTRNKIKHDVTKDVCIKAVYEATEALEIERNNVIAERATVNEMINNYEKLKENTNIASACAAATTAENQELKFQLNTASTENQKIKSLLFTAQKNVDELKIKLRDTNIQPMEEVVEPPINETNHKAIIKKIRKDYEDMIAAAEGNNRRIEEEAASTLAITKEKAEADKAIAERKTKDLENQIASLNVVIKELKESHDNKIKTMEAEINNLKAEDPEIQIISPPLPPPPPPSQHTAPVSSSTSNPSSSTSPTTTEEISEQPSPPSPSAEETSNETLVTVDEYPPNLKPAVLTDANRKSLSNQWKKHINRPDQPRNVIIAVYGKGKILEKKANLDTALLNIATENCKCNSRSRCKCSIPRHHTTRISTPKGHLDIAVIHVDTKETSFLRKVDLMLTNEHDNGLLHVNISQTNWEAANNLPPRQEETTNPASKPLKIFIKGLPTSKTTTKEEIAKILPITEFKRLDNGTIIAKIPNNAINANTIGRTTKITIDNHICDLEPERNFDIVIQCKRCQRYKHEDTRRKPCNYAPKCMHCARRHLTTECTSDRSKPVCANCGQAGHKGKTMKCSKFREQYFEAASRTKTSSKTTATSTTSRPQQRPADQPTTNSWKTLCNKCNTNHHRMNSCPSPEEISKPLFSLLNITNPNPTAFTSSESAYQQGKKDGKNGAEYTTLRITRTLSQTDQRRCQEYLNGLKKGASQRLAITDNIKSNIINELRKKSSAYQHD